MGEWGRLRHTEAKVVCLLVAATAAAHYRLFPTSLKKWASLLV